MAITWAAVSCSLAVTKPIPQRHRNESSCRCFPARPLLDGRYTQLFRNGHEKYPVKYSCCNYALFSGERESPNPLMIEGAGGDDAGLPAFLFLILPK